MLNRFSQSLGTTTIVMCLLAAVNGHSDDYDPVHYLQTIVDLVQAKHIDPPTRHEMILSGLKHLYLARKESPPQGLSDEVSSVGKADLREFMARKLSKFEDVPVADQVFRNGMLLAVLGDSFFLDAEATRVQGQLAANKYVGTGIALASTEQEYPSITKVFYQGPAWLAGIQTGDLILEIEGEKTKGKSLRHVVKMLRGEAGSKVSVVVRQPASAERRQITMTRNRVFIPTLEGRERLSEAEWQYTLPSAPDIAYVKVNSIGPSTLHEMKQIAAKLRGEELKGLVLDLRAGGGVLHDLVLFADALMDGGVIGHVRTADGMTTHEAQPGALFEDVPIAVLVTESIGPDRVFFAAALQDNDRAVIVGEHTQGSTFVYTHEEIPEYGESIRLAIGQLYRADKTPLTMRRLRYQPSIQSMNSVTDRSASFIIPDYHVSRYAVGTSNQDPMMEKAIEVLQQPTTLTKAAAADRR